MRDMQKEESNAATDATATTKNFHEEAMGCDDAMMSRV